jgi:cation diffusion facilitator family transporter
MTETKLKTQNTQVAKVTWVGLIVNLALAAFKFTAGIIGRSQAVTADAVHSLSDVSTDVAILVGGKYWSRPPDKTHPHGHNRLEILVTTGIGLVLIAVGCGIVWNAIATLSAKHDVSPPGMIAVIAAAVSIITKEILCRWTMGKSRALRSMPLLANAWHQRSDALSSLPALIAVAVARIQPNWAFVDHIGAVVVSLFIFRAAVRILRLELDKLLDGAAPAETVAAIHRIAGAVTGVLHVHGVRTRYVGGSHVAVDLHITVDPEMPVSRGHNISEEVKDRLLDGGLDIVDAVVHLEPDDVRPVEPHP